MTLDTSATTSSAKGNNTNTPPTIECIPSFFASVEGGRVQVDHRPQDIPLDDPCSSYMFSPVEKPFERSNAVMRAIPPAVITACLQRLTEFARKHSGLDSCQTFAVEGASQMLQFIDDGDDTPIRVIFSTES